MSVCACVYLCVCVSVCVAVCVCVSVCVGRVIGMNGVGVISRRDGLGGKVNEFG